MISFHSLEDGIVKSVFRAGKATGTWRELTKRPVIAEGAGNELSIRAAEAQNYGSPNARKRKVLPRLR